MFNLIQKWNFPSNNYGQIFGIADSGVETFKGTPYDTGLDQNLLAEIADQSAKKCLHDYVVLERQYSQVRFYLDGLND